MRPLCLLIALLAAGCQPAAETPGRVCTMEFRTIGLTVVDSLNAPVAEADVDVIRTATGRSIVCTGEQQYGCVVPGDGRGHRAASNDGVLSVWGAGLYEVMHDGVSVRGGGEMFRVEVGKGAARASEQLLFAHDGCHVRKLSGPDTLRLRF